MTLQWRPPETLNGIVTHYSILYVGININITNYDNNMLMDTVGGLSPDTVYVLQLRAHTGAGAGPFSRITFLTRKLSDVSNMALKLPNMHEHITSYLYYQDEITHVNGMCVST